jgi:hypothetical protein
VHAFRREAVLSCLRPEAWTLRDDWEALIERLVELRVPEHDLGRPAGLLDFTGRQVLVVGAGQCWHAPFLLSLGARQVTCVDLHVDERSRQVRDLRQAAGAYAEMPLTLAEFLGAFDGLALVRADIAEVDLPAGRFERVLLQTVSEHLLDPDRAFARIAALMAPHAEMYLTHGNFYCWNGHHLQPQTLGAYDPSNEAHRQYADWNHILNRGRIDPRFIALNFLRLHELAALLKRHFTVSHLELLRSPPEIEQRLTPALRLRLADYYHDELLTEIAEFVVLKPERAHASDTPAAEAPRVVVIALSPDNYREDRCFLVALPFGVTPEHYRLYEDETLLGPADALHDDIRHLGRGRYSVWGPCLYLSSSDGSDPTTNGRRYTLRHVDALPAAGTA